MICCRAPVSALASADQFDLDTQLEAWAYTIMKSVWIDGLRKRREVAMDQELLANHPGGDVAAEAESRIRLAEVRKQIAKLPEEQRVVLLLVSVEGMKYREAAAVLGCPIGTVMSRLSRAPGAGRGARWRSRGGSKSHRLPQVNR
jgi:RNA polymerase sigma-70 factor, ECF subfamily